MAEDKPAPRTDSFQVLRESINYGQTGSGSSGSSSGTSNQGNGESGRGSTGSGSSEEKR